MGAENTKICGPTKGQNSWRIRADDELQVVCAKPTVLAIVNVRRLYLAGHVIRMSDDRTIRKVFLGKPDGRIK
jgi:hypothetical protein